MSYYIAMDRYGNYDLAHHGILGQKWGVRRYQNKDGSLTAAGKNRYGGTETRTVAGKQKDPHKKKGDLMPLVNTIVPAAASYASMAASVAMLLTTGVPVPMLAASSVSSLLSTGVLATKTIQAGEAAVKEALSNKRLANAPIDSKTGLRKKDRDWTEEEDVKAINPGFKNFNSNTKQNCVLCSVAYDLRRRGFDVVAGKAGTGYTDKEYSTWYKNSKPTDITGNSLRELSKRMNNASFNPIERQKDIKHMLNTAEKELSSQGVGARGILSLKLSAGSGHAVAYTVTKDGIKIYDCQSGKTMTLKQAADLSIGLSYTRLDNCKPNYELLKKEGVVH